MVKKIVLSMGSLLVLLSVILAVYVGTQSIGGSMFDLEGVFSCMMIIGCPMLLGSVLIIVSVQNEIKRKLIIALEVILLCMYGIIVFALVFGGFRMHMWGYQNNQSFIDYIRWNSNFIPFKTIFYYVACLFSGQINRSIIIENLLGNFMMFMPAGLLLPAIFSKQRNWVPFLLTIAVALISIEIVQLAFRLGSFDIDDFILNMTGACLVYGIIRIGKINRFLNKIRIL